MTRREPEHMPTDLPTVTAIGDELHRAFRVQERAETQRHRRRRARRLVVALASVLVLVPGAVATRNIWAPTPDAIDPRRPLQESTPVIIARGGSGENEWQLSVYDSPKGRCLQIRVATAEGSQGGGCDSLVPRQRDLQVQITNGPTHGFVFGATSAQISHVAVAAGSAGRLDVETQEAPSEELRRSGTRGDFRFYVAEFAKPVDIAGGLTAIAYDAAGRPIDRFGDVR